MPISNQQMYESDLYTWTQHQVRELKTLRNTGDYPTVDWDNIIDEIDSLGRAELRKFKDLIKNIVRHLISIERSASSDSCSHWYREIHTFREQALDILLNNHTLKDRITDADYEQIWRKGSHDFAWHFYDDPKESKQVERSLRTSQMWGWDEICGFDSRVNPAQRRPCTKPTSSFTRASIFYRSATYAPRIAL